MVKTPSFKRLILRAVLRQVSPMVIRLVSVADQMPLHQFHDVFRTILGWNGDLGRASEDRELEWILTYNNVCYEGVHAGCSWLWSLGNVLNRGLPSQFCGQNV